MVKRRKMRSIGEMGVNKYRHCKWGKRWYHMPVLFHEKVVGKMKGVSVRGVYVPVDAGGSRIYGNSGFATQ
jgi:hypothetical protein